MKARPVKSVRCAIYTRVSTEQGLDQDFNSLDAQYEAASAYIKSQAHDGWTLIRSRYDDGGYSGGSTDRPDLQRLLEDIRARKIDVIVVYKVDRLTRSLEGDKVSEIPAMQALIRTMFRAAAQGDTKAGRQLSSPALSCTRTSWSSNSNPTTRYPIARMIGRSLSLGRSRHRSDPARSCFHIMRRETKSGRNSSNAGRAWSAPSLEGVSGSMM